MLHRLLQATEAFNVPEGTAWGLLVGLLSTFVVVNLVPLFLMPKESAVRNLLRPTDSFMSARGQSGWVAIALSFFASGMGAWVVYGTTELGALRAVSWWGVIGYSTGAAFPAVLFCVLGPRIRAVVGAAKGFSATDFALKRYGRLMQLHVVCVSCFYMYIYMVAELTSIGNVFALLVGKDTTGSESKHFTTKVTIIVALFTWFYTALCGLPASILTDKLQGVCIAALCTLLLIAVSTQKQNDMSRKEFDEATGWFSKGFEAFVILWIALASAELFNQGNWQRVWAAKSDTDLRIGFALGGVLITAVMIFFGVMGMTAYAKDRAAYDTYQKLAYLSFFDLLQPLERGWHLATLAVVTMLTASSLDTLQNGITSVLSRDLLNHKLSANWSRLILVAFNVMAIVQASDRYDVVPLFLVADIVCATAVMPLFLGLITQDLKFPGGFYVAAPTELGAFLGALAGIVTVIVNGEINDVNTAENPYTGKVYDKSIFAYFWLINEKHDGTPYECALCGPKTMVTFIVTPLISAAATFLFSTVDVYVGGNKAREPFLIVPRLDDAMVNEIEDTDPEALVKLTDEARSQEKKDDAALKA